MVRRIRDRHARRLRGKTAEGVIAFYRAAGQQQWKTLQFTYRPVPFAH